ncbi:MAG: hypothetical protein ACOY90_20885 [Candidatus Zhuqueibacterota bacterium]
MQKHITFLGALHIGLSILGLLIAAFIFSLLTTIGFISQDETALLVLSIIGLVIASFLVLTAIPGIIGGIGLLKRKSWARILILIVAAIDLLDFPLGTALSVYSFWVLLQDESAKIFSAENQKTVIV